MPLEKTSRAGTATGPTTFVVVYDEEAAAELAAIRDKKLRRAVLAVVEKLRLLGPKTIEPHAKKIQGATKLRELRPKGGQSVVRPLYFQRSGSEFVILTIGPEAEADPSGFKAAVRRAQSRAASRFNAEV